MPDLALASLAAQRLQTATYVEARGFLQPAVDFYTRAVTAADRANSMTGDLLAFVSRTTFQSCRYQL